jgi:hypothetical protein
MRQALPFKVPDSLSIPYVGTVTGDGVVYVLLAGLVVALLLVFILIGIIRGSGARARLAAAVIDEASRGVTVGSTLTVNTTAATPVRPMAEIGASTPYRTIMAQIACHLADVEATNICIGELEGGYLLLYSRAGEPMVETLTSEQVAALPISQKQKRATALLRQNLTRVGRFLDQQFAISVLVAQQEGGYYIEYASTPSGAHSASKLVRVSRLMDDEALSRMGTGALG